ncbi:hypothetical protein M2T28_14385 [Elizabethkingia miricola]|uniref:hypothetical protein n=1 Tax=Elizabethkingia TaxID=308865 RepID=UPI0010C22659|nr:MULTISPECIES: hypothetical protein [Elizabethkingia]MCL1653807.1 hypothetical protein [Elizabethkingia miricola]QCO45791.1 hypothetical protein FCS00_05185 [Elizabethkingia sp. 2-6]
MKHVLYIVICLAGIISLINFLESKSNKVKSAKLQCELGMNLYKLEITKYKGNFKKSDSAYNSDIDRILNDIYKK